MRPFLLLTFVIAVSASTASGERPGPHLDPIMTRLIHGPGTRMVSGAPHSPQSVSLRHYARRFAIDAESAPPRVRVWMRLDLRAREELGKVPGLAMQSVVGSLVSAIVPIPSLEVLAKTRGIEWIRVPARPVPELDVSIPEIGADLSASTYGFRGRNVTVGIVDSGVDITHADFRNPDGTTRISHLWDQTVDCGAPPAPFTYGCLYTQSQIDDALGGMGSVSSPDTLGHGSHVAGIAAGNGLATGNGHPPGSYVGVGDRSMIVAVKVIPDSGEDCPLCDLGDALVFIDSQSVAAGRPWVTNISLGHDLGGHDGSDPIEQLIDTLTGSGIPGKVVVKSGGNRRGSGIHASATALQFGVGRTFTIWPYTPGPGVLDDVHAWQMWYDAADELRVRIVTPSGGFLQTFTGDCVCSNNFSQFCTVDEDCPGGVCDGFLGANAGPEGAIAFDQTCAPAPNGSRAFNMELSDVFGSAPAAGTWAFNVYALNIPSGGKFDTWIWFSSLGTNQISVPWNFPVSTGLVTIPGTAFHTTTVGSYSTKASWTNIDDAYFEFPVNIGALSGFSSPGPSRDGRVKPDIAAPGEYVASALSSDAASRVLGSADRDYVMQDGVHWALRGTSMAAPHVAGVYAQLLELDPTLDAEQLRTLVTGSARADGLTGSIPNNDWGFGKLDAIGAMENLIKYVNDLSALDVDTFTFSGIAEADTYRVFRADLSSLDGTNYGICLIQGMASTVFDDPSIPALGDGFGYLVAGERDGVTGFIGITSDGTVRQRPACP